MLFDVIYALIFLWSVTGMLKVSYELLEFGIGFYIKQIALFIVISVVLELAVYVRRLPAVGMRLGVFAVEAVWVLWHFWKEDVAERMLSGLKSFAGMYLSEWNEYYGMTLKLPVGSAKYIVESVEFVLLAAVLLFFAVAKTAKKNSIMAILPVLVFVSQLLIGKSPTGWSLILLFAGVLLANSKNTMLPDFGFSEGKGSTTSKSSQLFGWLPAVGIILVLCGLVFGLGRNSAEYVVEEYADEAEDLIMDTAESIAEWDFWRWIEDPGGVEDMIESALGKKDFNQETLDNSTPEFDDVPLFLMTTKHLLSGTIYLKGFYADTYNSGVWEKNPEGFEQACLAAGYDLQEVKEELANLALLKLKAHYHVSRLARHTTGVKTTVRYYKPETIKAYLPYFSEVDENEIEVDGEGNFKKRKSDKELEAVVWSYSTDYEAGLQEIEYVKDREWEAWYEYS